MASANERQERESGPASTSVSGPDLGSLPSLGQEEQPRTRADDAVLPEGHIIAGKYRVERIVGRGGMGVVYLARHIALEEPVAIKVLLPDMMEIAGMVSRFEREARAASKIKSEHVARVSDVDRLPSGVPYIVMEYLQGIDLAALRRKVGPLPIAEATTHIAQACDAIAEAHGLGIVHRDLKPSNLFLTERRDDRRMIKVLDFGISKVENPRDQDTTSTGMTMGSPKYMSPEQMKSLRDVDGRTDIWALGAILYDLLAGRPPFLAESMAQVCTLVLHGEPPPLRSLRPEVPLELKDIVERCLRKVPTERFATADDLARALSPFCVPGTVKLPAVVRQQLPSVTVPVYLDEPEPEPASRGTATRRLDDPGPPPAEPLPAPSAGTLATWDAPAPAPRRSRAAAVVIAGVLLVAGAAFAMSYGGAQPEAPAQAGGSPPAQAVVPASAKTAVDAPALSPADLPDSEQRPEPAEASPTGDAPRAPRPALPAPRPGKKTPAGADPFGGSRN